MNLTKRIIKILIYLLIIVVAAFFEVSFLKTLGWPFSYLQIILTVSIFAAIVFNLNYSFFWIILGGYLLDLYSPFPFGLTIISVLIAVLIVKKLSLWRLASRTIYSLIILTILGTLIYHLIFFGFNELMLFFQKSSIDYGLDFTKILWHITDNILLLILLFVLFKQITTRFKTAYL